MSTLVNQGAIEIRISDSDEWRDPVEVVAEERGILTVEWVLVTAAFILPVAAALPTMLYILKVYYYRVAGIISLPFP